MTSTPPPHGAQPDADSAARAERAALADLFDRVGPDAPTMCEGWTTRDLAAHLVARERRPDAAAGIVVPALAGYGDRVRRRVAAGDWAELVDAVRRPPWWTFSALGPVDRVANTMEYFVHHEDVRRAAPDWSPRPLSGDLARRLWARVPGLARLSLRRLPASVTVVAPGYGEATGGAGGPRVRLEGDPGELVLFLVGRQRVARVGLTGPDELTERLRRARLGI